MWHGRSEALGRNLSFSGSALKMSAEPSDRNSYATATIGSDGRSHSGLVGRERECTPIERLLANAREGLSGSLVVRGEAGLGKTALLGYAADRASGMRVLRVTGVQAEYDLAFAGLHAMLWPIVDDLGRLPEAQRGALAAALGLARARVATGSWCPRARYRCWRLRLRLGRSCAWWMMRSGLTCHPRIRWCSRLAGSWARGW
jgi:AAA ATPase domain